MCQDDHFSMQADYYVRYRPRYPADLFIYLASLAPGHELAWDAGTGNGQAALGLAVHFSQVVATDASERQIAHAFRHARIRFRVGLVEEVDLERQSVDIITSAQSIHWFDLGLFYECVFRVLRPGGLIAVWCYDRTEIDPAIDRIVKSYSSEIVGPYWPPEIQLVDERYSSLSFPFTEILPPEFACEANWRLEDVVGYLHSWSSTQAFIEQQGYDPVDEIRPALAKAWGSPNLDRRVRWPLYMRVGYLPENPSVSEPSTLVDSNIDPSGLKAKRLRRTTPDNLAAGSRALAVRARAYNNPRQAEKILPAFSVPDRYLTCKTGCSQRCSIRAELD
ncbi:MAG TPA: class I SAM-dependent methyltransferase [Anaerolineales bacterium]|jgi:SAM-dependent methyltransferase|nr:class I SAM-dependent methyltransferase [Anaerolineales bacterium]